MAQLPCIGLYKPCINLPFEDCAMYFDHGVIRLADPSLTWARIRALPVDPNGVFGNS